jgi:hypothetical protein
MKDEIEKTLKMGVIQPSSSDWVSPIILVKKPCGGLRFCVESRKLNKQLEKDRYPTSRVQDIIDQLARNSNFSTTDINFLV